jgi:hypothetical protein
MFEINCYYSNLRNCFNICLEELRKSKEMFRESRLYAGQNLKPLSPKLKSQDFLAKYIEYLLFVH